MGAPIGVTGGKFIMIGAALLMHGRVNGDNARIDVEPGAPTSAIGPAFAGHVRARDRDATLGVLVRAISLTARIKAIAPDIAQDADLRIGQDILRNHVVAVDFRHGELDVLSQSDAHHLEHLSMPIAIRHEPDGTLSIDAADGDGAAVPTRLDLSSDLAFASPDLAPEGTLKIGGVDLGKVDVSHAPQPVVGLYAFRHARIIFDLGHDRIWMRR